MDKDTNDYANLGYNVSSGNKSAFIEGINLLPDSTTIDPKENCSNYYCLEYDEYMEMIYGYIRPNTFEWILVFFYLIVFLVGLVGNFLVCFAVWKNYNMRTVTNLFIVNLAVADLLVILVCLPPTVLEDVTETWYMGSVMCKVVKYAQGVSVSVSILTLTAISVERYFAICEPMAFKGTMGRARIIITLIWIASLLFIMPEPVTVTTYHGVQDNMPTLLLTSCRPSWNSNSQVVYQAVMMIFLYIIPLGFMGLAYVMIAMVLWVNNIPTETSTIRKNRTPAGKPVKSPAETQMQSRRNVAKMLIAVVVMFGMCYLPVHLLNILRYSKVDLNAKFALVAHWLCYFNSAINPVIYNFMSAKFRKEFRTACCCCVHKSRLDFNKTRYDASSYAYKMTSDVTQTEHINLGNMSSGSDTDEINKVPVKLYSTMYDSASAV